MSYFSLELSTGCLTPEQTSCHSWATFSLGRLFFVDSSLRWEMSLFEFYQLLSMELCGMPCLVWSNVSFWLSLFSCLVNCAATLFEVFNIYPGVFFSLCVFFAKQRLSWSLSLPFGILWSGQLLIPPLQCLERPWQVCTLSCKPHNFVHINGQRTQHRFSHTTFALEMSLPRILTFSLALLLVLHASSLQFDLVSSLHSFSSKVSWILWQQRPPDIWVTTWPLRVQFIASLDLAYLGFTETVSRPWLLPSRQQNEVKRVAMAQIKVAKPILLP